MTSLFEFLDQNHSASTLFIDPGKERTYTWENIISSYSLNATPKRLAFLYLDNSINSVSYLLSFLKSPHCIALLNHNLDVQLKERLEKLYEPDFVVDVSGRIPGQYELIGTTDGVSVYFKQSSSDIHPDLKILLSTSGTTGSPKFVKLTESNFIENIKSVTAYLPIQPADMCPLNLPITYSYGLSVLLTNIYKGGQILCSNETVLSRGFWDMFGKYGCTSLAGVPYTYEMLTRLGFLKMSLPHLRYITQAGGKLNEKTMALFANHSQQHNYNFFVMYGQTEATARMSYLDPNELSGRMGSIGKPVMNGSFSIDPDNNELVYKGPNVGAGYAETRADLALCTPLTGLRTGDMARKDEDGFYYITGRLKRFVKLFGNRISLDEVENSLKNHLGYAIGCMGVNDQHMLIFSDNPAANEALIKNYVSEKYHLHISVIRYKFIEKIPLNSSQKTDYQEIYKQYAG